MLPYSDTTLSPISVVIRGVFGATVTIATISMVSYASILGSWYLPSGKTTHISSGNMVSSASTSVQGASCVMSVFRATNCLHSTLEPASAPIPGVSLMKSSSPISCVV